MKNLIKGTAVLGAIVVGAASTFLTVGAATTDAAETSPAPTTTNSTATITQTGALNLDSAPSIDFGSQAYTVGETKYASSAIGSDLHVTNPGFASGWSVTVSATPFTDSATSNTLKGTTLSLDSSKAAPITADDSSNVSGLPSYVAPLTIGSSATEVESAGAGDGVGAYSTSYGAADASLNVPAGNLPGTYSSTLTWTLNDAPA
ncbi:WxL domain-containing protein [Companilactobacillus allii]|uniref:WxL domain-containing protein n=1 Tax=Companilactobacillus allii TaxID=1847728 RepID=A0A1P8Q5T3_9LACO|nr:WxL domain-containing protein [Companilactobacillus allii]APX73190.1 hypothetical protein BTM29_11795 [Companilactobacillus allii]USQ67998.1 WxL domain-containing protein [Companilactobacillus allii]